MLSTNAISGFALYWEIVSSEGVEVASEIRGDLRRGEGEAAGLDTETGRGRPPERRLTLEIVEWKSSTVACRS
jgi:hypothetical protein